MTHDEFVNKIDEWMFKQVEFRTNSLTGGTNQAQLSNELWDLQRILLKEIRRLYDDSDALEKYLTKTLVDDNLIIS